MNFLFWNLRGIGKGEKTSSVRKLVMENKISCMGIVETKHKNSLRGRMRRMWGHDGFDLCEVFANENFAGGLVVVWDPSCFEVIYKHHGERWIILEGCIKANGFVCCVGVIYGPNDRVGRSILFEELKNTLLSINKPMLLLGDFNTILHPSERIGIFRCEASMRDFSEWIQNLGLIDIPLKGVKFTWKRNTSKSKIDRGLCCNEWVLKFPNMTLMGHRR